MPSRLQTPHILVTGACGHIGKHVCECLKASRLDVLPTDLGPQAGDFVRCDLTATSQVARLFKTHPIGAVIHLAGVLPGAFRADPLLGAQVNLGASVELLRRAVNAKVKRFVLASSMSVYGSSFPARPVAEDQPAIPDEPYGTAKRAIESLGEALAKNGAIEFVSLRIARVVGPGIKKTSSPWRSQIFDARPASDSVCVPYAPNAVLSLVHVREVARMLVVLAAGPKLTARIYNTPVELWEAWRLKEIVEQVRGVRIELTNEEAHGGPICDGRRFTHDFRFQLRGLKDYLQN